MYRRPSVLSSAAALAVGFAATVLVVAFQLGSALPPVTIETPRTDDSDPASSPGLTRADDDTAPTDLAPIGVEERSPMTKRAMPAESRPTDPAPEAPHTIAPTVPSSRFADDPNSPEQTAGTSPWKFRPASAP